MSKYHQVWMRLDDEAFHQLDRYAMQHRWTRSAAARNIVETFLALDEELPGQQPLFIWPPNRTETEKLQ